LKNKRGETVDNILDLFSNPIVIVVICVAFAFPLLGGVTRILRKKLDKMKGKDNANAQHVRDVVKKYDSKNQK
jgi:fumarate reductase subunit C